MYFGAVVQVILTQLPGQEIQFELFDKDIDQDDFLGRFVQHTGCQFGLLENLAVTFYDKLFTTRFFCDDTKLC